MSKLKVAIIIPCHNEQKHIGKLLRRLQPIAKRLRLITVVIDDGSTDDSHWLARPFADYTLRHELNLGKGAALRTGCEFAFQHINCTHVIMMDADEQHAPADLSKFVAAIRLGQELVLGVRSFAGMPRQAMVANKFSSFAIKLFTGVFVPDIPSGYKAMSRRVFRQLQWQVSGYDVEFAIAWQIARQRLSFQEVPIQTLYPDYARGMTALDGIKVVLNMLGLR